MAAKFMICFKKFTVNKTDIYMYLYNKSCLVSLYSSIFILNKLPFGKKNAKFPI